MIVSSQSPPGTLYCSLVILSELCCSPGRVASDTPSTPGEGRGLLGSLCRLVALRFAGRGRQVKGAYFTLVFCWSENKD